MTYKWTLDKMITEQRAASVARALFADEYSDGSDCRNEIGREGKPCGLCLSRNALWQERVTQVRAAMMEAFR